MMNLSINLVDENISLRQNITIYLYYKKGIHVVRKEENKARLSI